MVGSDTNENIIVTNNLNFRYGKIHALKDVNLRIRKGSIYGFLGPNGAGKTTMIKAMVGLLKTHSGSVEIFGKELQKDRVSILSRIGTMVETPSLYPALSGFENVEIVRILRGIEKDATWIQSNRCCSIILFSWDIRFKSRNSFRPTQNETNIAKEAIVPVTTADALFLPGAV